MKRLIPGLSALASQWLMPLENEVVNQTTGEEIKGI